jgi:hypothetical protein
MLTYEAKMQAYTTERAAWKTFRREGTPAAYKAWRKAVKRMEA